MRLALLPRGLLVLAAAALVLGWWFASVPAAGTLAAGVRVGTLPLGGLTVSEAERSIQVRFDDIAARGWTFSYAGDAVNVSPTASSTEDPDVAYALAAVDVAATVQRAYAAGRRLRLPWERQPIVVPAAVAIRDDKVAEAVTLNFPDLEWPAAAPGFARGDAGGLILTPPVSGQRVDWPAVMREVRTALERLEAPTVHLAAIVEQPAVRLADVPAAVVEDVAGALAANLPLMLTYEGQRWELAEADVLPHLTLELQQPSGVRVALRPGFWDAAMGEVVAAIDRPTQAPRFKLEGNRATLWQPPLAGQRVDAAATTQRIVAALLRSEPAAVAVAVESTPAPSVDGEAAALGITELLGVGRSNFKGSPKNRRHNIGVGAAALNGLLVKSGEEFSLVRALGTVDAAAGYLPELVIKGNRTVPEYGGGLCQIGTTIFRAALASGLPILERQNHSFRVRYYEPAGTDATIYDPKPDFRFQNDTGHAVLIQTAIKGDDLIFEFWGTRDGRVATQTTPRVFNVTPPPPRRVIETTELKPGVEKCTEHAVAGADAEFTYTIVYADGAKQEQVFRSHYRPWQEVCLLGVAALSTTPADDAASTPESAAPGADSPAVVVP